MAQDLCHFILIKRFKMILNKALNENIFFGKNGAPTQQYCFRNINCFQCHIQYQIPEIFQYSRNDACKKWGMQVAEADYHENVWMITNTMYVACSSCISSVFTTGVISDFFLKLLFQNIFL